MTIGQSVASIQTIDIPWFDRVCSENMFLDITLIFDQTATASDLAAVRLWARS